MIKECVITINNEAVTVAAYDDVLVQFPSIHSPKAKTVNVNRKNNRYYIVDGKGKAETTKDEPSENDESTAKEESAE